MYFYVEKGKKAEIVGRGLSFGDAFSHFSFSLPTFPQDKEEAQKLYRNGRLRFKEIDGEAVAMIQYDGEETESLCCAFQSKLQSGTFVDLDVFALCRALDWVVWRKRHEQ